uniref:Alpha/beta hydrolase fold-3 domain-containing protein n=1 Tax=Romanomermis culicivorax TaxID=13658 RepID=A0A915L9U9_ROMCU
MVIRCGILNEGSKEYGKSMVKTLVSDGAVVAVVGYNLSPKVAIPQIVDEVAEQLKFIIEWSRMRLASQKSPIHLMGHSAGAQLIFQALLKLPKAIGESVLSLILISGVYDLEPLIGTEMNKSLKLDRALAYSLSPINNVREIHIMYGAHLKLSVVVGEDDTPTFVAQSREFFKTLEQYFTSSESISLHILPHYHHFNIIVGLGCKEESVYELIDAIAPARIIDAAVGVSTNAALLEIKKSMSTMFKWLKRVSGDYHHRILLSY